MRRALITGARGGIGVALTHAFSKAGYAVIGLDIGSSRPRNCDSYLDIDLAKLVGDPTFREEALGRLRNAVGDGGLNALVNNAATQRVGPFRDTTLADWRETIDTNLLAPVFLIKELLSSLEAVDGSIVNVSSIHARLTKPSFAAYATSKAALSGLTRALAVEFGQTVRVNAIEPAAILTPMLREGFEGKEKAFEELKQCHPVNRLGRPEEVASLCVYLCSEEAAFINGAQIGLDGGISSRLHDPG